MNNPVEYAKAWIVNEEIEGTMGGDCLNSLLEVIDVRTAQLLHITGLADQIMEQVLPQAGGIVLDIGVANDLCIKIREVKNEHITSR